MCLFFFSLCPGYSHHWCICVHLDRWNYQCFLFSNSMSSIESDFPFPHQLPLSWSFGHWDEVQNSLTDFMQLNMCAISSTDCTTCVVSYACLSPLMLLPLLNTLQTLSSRAVHIICSPYMLNMCGDIIHPCLTPFLTGNFLSIDHWVLLLPFDQYREHSLCLWCVVGPLCQSWFYSKGCDQHS